ncbi:MAG: hypothetical protein K8R92_02565 [Planctomycetes bacterium]|nr:hypothetical protein [Planctomycetota bacterium]
MSTIFASRRSLSVLALSAMIAPCAMAIDGQSTTPDGAAFASVAAGSQAFSGLGAPGDAVQGGVSTLYVNAQTSTSGIGGTATANASNSGSSGIYPFSNNAFGSASVGTIKLSAYNNGSMAVSFPGASANAGWNDQFTLTGGGANGTTGIWVVPIVVNGSMTALVNGASGTMQVAAYKSHNILQPYGSAINSQAYNLFNALNTTHNGTIFSGWDYQMVAFGTTNWGPSDSSSLPFMSISNRTLSFAIPFTWGTAFSAGFYANLMAGERASGGFGGQTTTDLDFSNTILWGGKGYVVGSEGNITDFSIDSLSGFNYGAPAPAPSTFALLCSSLAVLARRRRNS